MAFRPGAGTPPKVDVAAASKACASAAPPPAAAACTVVMPRCSQPPAEMATELPTLWYALGAATAGPAAPSNSGTKRSPCGVKSCGVAAVTQVTPASADTEKEAASCTPKRSGGLPAPDGARG